MIFSPDEAAEVIHDEMYPMQVVQGPTAIFGSNDDLPPVCIAAESIWSEAHLEPKVSSAQAHPSLDSALDHGSVRSGLVPHHVWASKTLMPFPHRT